jgi:prepilin-type N-terminal cleavage/methylation domain-containing protein
MYLKPTLPRCNRGGFTLIELLCAIGIIALLATLLVPVSQRIFVRADALRCMNNLRQIGMAVSMYASDNNDEIPRIETNPEQKVYSEDANAKGMLETLRKYGVTEQVVQCPADLKGPNYYSKMKTSYEWRPLGDGEKKANPMMYRRRGAFAIPPGRLRIATDFTPVHGGEMNRLYADGKVRGPY